MVPSIMASHPGPEADIFLANVRLAFVFFFGQQWLLPWNSPMDAVFAQCLSYC